MARGKEEQEEDDDESSVSDKVDEHTVLVCVSEGQAELELRGHR